MEISDDDLDSMVTFSSGLPLMMQQIGESVFWACGTDYITKTDAFTGIINAANEIGLKQIRPILDQINETYEKILQNLVDNQSLKPSKKKMSWIKLIFQRNLLTGF